MTKAQRTRRALLASAVALVLCVSMLLGTTYAWFTDSATSSGNIIQAGELDLEMYWANDPNSGAWYDVEDEDYNTIFDYDNWEPGYTEVKYIKLVNDGNLSLNYQLLFSPVGLVGKLAEVLQVYYAEEAVELHDRSDLEDLRAMGLLSTVLNDAVSIDGTLLPEGQVGNYDSGETIITLALSMLPSAGNDYQDKTAGDGFSITAVATQCASEKDTFDNQYDKTAQFPAVVVGDSATAPVVTANGAVAQPVFLQGKNISATIPAGVLVEDGTKKLVLTVDPMKKTNSNLEAAGSEKLFALDVHIEGVAEDNTTPIVINLGAVLPANLNLGNYALTHVEDGGNQTMQLVSSAAELTAHNSFTYDPATGEVSVAMATFSEVVMVIDSINPWEGNADYTWYDADPNADTFSIANADQLYAFAKLVGGMRDGSMNGIDFEGKTVKLTGPINLGGEQSAKIFYPIGYYNNSLNVLGKVVYDRDSGVNVNGQSGISSNFKAFSGTFDGQGHTITGIYQNTWEMFGDYNSGYSGTPNYYKDGMGLFGYVENGTVKNLTINDFQSTGEFAPTGCVSAFGEGNATFENITITYSHPQTYNTGVAGIVGWDNGDGNHYTFRNITIDATNTISALWGSWDVSAAGLLGSLKAESSATLDNCHVAATIDVYNDVCGNYQYYWYRYTGALVGTVYREHSNGKLDLSKIKATDCSVNFGDRHEYYYCEFVKNTQASYTHDHQFSRVDHKDLIFEDGIAKKCTHNHADSGTETDPDTKETVLREDKQAVYIPYRQLFGGYGWGVDGVDVGEYDGVIEVESDGLSVQKFAKKHITLAEYPANKTIRLGDVFMSNFASTDTGKAIKKGTLQVTVTSADPGSTATGVYVPATDDAEWGDGTLTFSGEGSVYVTITDYYFCKPLTVKLRVYKELFTNGDFEKGAERPWVNFKVAETAGTSVVATVTEGVGVDGSYGLKMGSKKTYGSVLFSNNEFFLEKNTTYRLSFMATTTSVADSVRVAMNNWSDCTLINASSKTMQVKKDAKFDGWYIYYLDFRTGDGTTVTNEDGSTVEKDPYIWGNGGIIIVRSQEDDRKVCFDNFSLRKIEDTPELFPGGDPDVAIEQSVAAAMAAASTKLEVVTAPTDSDPNNKAYKVVDATSHIWFKNMRFSSNGVYKISFDYIGQQLKLATKNVFTFGANQKSSEIKVASSPDKWAHFETTLNIPANSIADDCKNWSFAIHQDTTKNGATALIDNISIVKVESPEATGVTLSDLTVYQGADKNVVVAYTPKVSRYESIVWESDNEAVATVAGGKVTGVSAGTANIKVTVKVNENVTLTDTCVVTVVSEQPTTE